MQSYSNSCRINQARLGDIITLNCGIIILGDVIVINSIKVNSQYPGLGVLIFVLRD